MAADVSTPSESGGREPEAEESLRPDPETWGANAVTVRLRRAGGGDPSQELRALAGLLGIGGLMVTGGLVAEQRWLPAGLVIALTLVTAGWAGWKAYVGVPPPAMDLTIGPAEVRLGHRRVDTRQLFRAYWANGHLVLGLRDGNELVSDRLAPHDPDRVIALLEAVIPSLHEFHAGRADAAETAHRLARIRSGRSEGA